MSRWSLIPPLPGESPTQALERLVTEQNLIYAELEQLDLQLRGDGGYTARLSGTLDAQGNRITGLPQRPQTDTDAISLSFAKSGRFMYTEGDTFQTSRRVEHAQAISREDSVTLGQLEALLAARMNDALPPGTIVLWSGTIAAIPTGWALCNGASGTPDLRDRFLVGAGGAYAVNATGGATTHTHVAHPALAHSGTAVADHAAQVHSGTAVADHAAQVHSGTAVADHAAFTHGSGGAHTHDAHTTAADTTVTGAATRLTGPGTHSSDGGHTHDAHAAQVHAVTQPANHPILAHAVTQPADHPTLVHAVTQPADHPAQSHDSPDHRPLFYALAYIMKL